MEDEKKTQPTSENESNPIEEDEVKVTDLSETEETPSDRAEAGENGEGKEKPEEEKEVKAPPKQDRKTDSEYAERRRKQKERELAKQKEREEEIRRQAIFEVKSGQVTAQELNELSLAKVETSDQLFLVEELRKAKALGEENPQAAAYKALFQKQEKEKAESIRLAEEKKKAEERQVEIVRKDQIAFKEKFGKTTAEVMKNEPDFMELFGSLIDAEKGNFTELYEVYEKIKVSHREEAKKDGSLPLGGNGKGSNTPKSDKPMTRAEFEAYWKKKYNS